MVALTALATALGAAASVAGVVSANQAKSEAKRQAKKQETAAKEAAALETPIKKDDPNFQLGTDDPNARRRTGATRGDTTIKPGTSLSTGGISASTVGGL